MAAHDCSRMLYVAMNMEAHAKSPFGGRDFVSERRQPTTPAWGGPAAIAGWTPGQGDNPLSVVGLRQRAKTTDNTRMGRAGSYCRLDSLPR